MKNLFKVALTLSMLVVLNACSTNVSKTSEDTVANLTVNGDDIARDSTMQSGTTVTNTKSTTSITVDPATNDSTIVTTTVIKHYSKK